SPENTEQFFEAYVFMLDHMLQTLPGGAHPGVWSWLRELRALPHPPLIGLLTGNLRLGAEIKLRRFDLWNEFETGAFADDSAERDASAAAAKRRGEALLGVKLRGEEVLVIGDTPNDITCARAIGAKVLAVGTGMYRPKDLQAFHPDWVVDNLEKISPGAIC